MNSPVPSPDDFFRLSPADAASTYFADTRMLSGKQLTHYRFRTDPKTIIDHMVELLALKGSEDLLDLGCGDGFIAEGVRPHMAAGRIVGLDVAPGVLEAARERLFGVATRCEWLEGRADDLSRFADDSFDRVMANYMMHYVDDIDTCVADVRRVLRDGGRFILATDHPSSLREMHEVHFAALAEMNAPQRLFKASPKNRVSLENGQRYLSDHFAQVEVRRWQDPLRFSQPEPFLDFYASHNYCCAASAPGDPHTLGQDFFLELRERVRARVQQVIDHHGHFTVTKDTGAFVCS
ncbi:class I SAM-dependent methyltransferase [Streptomyces griseoincarnatus]